MITITIRTVTALVVLLTITLAGVGGPVAAQEDCDTACLDPGDGSPEVDAGGEAPFGTPVVELFLKAKKAFTDEFDTFLKAKKAF